tara:strand:- start:28 stop:300 length:273 start_codon:yes stop_codon:yes gene_type:complete
MTDRFNKIATIAKHWAPQLGTDTLSLAMALDAVDSLHSLRLDDMIADLDAGSVAHDVAGIWNNLDRKSKLLLNCWMPRFGSGINRTPDDY